MPTPYNNPYIPGDPYSYDLKWIVEELKTAISLYQPLHDEFVDLSDQFADLKQWVLDYFDGEVFEAQLDAALRVLAADGTLSTLIQPLFDAYEEDINNEIDVLIARMDAFASLPAGSTAGNAELLDIRVGYDAKTWPSAGDAVRGQADELANNIENAYKHFDAVTLSWELGSFYSDGLPTSSTNRLRTTARTEVNGKIRFYIAAGYKLNYVEYAGPTTNGVINGTFFTESGEITTTRRWVHFILGREDNADMTVTEAENAIVFLENADYMPFKNYGDLNEFLFPIKTCGRTDDEWQTGNINVAAAPDYVYLETSSTRISFTERVPVPGGDKIAVFCPTGANWRLLMFGSSGPISADGNTTNIRYLALNSGDAFFGTWQTGDAVISIPEGVNAFAMSVKYADNSSITPNSRPDVYAVVLPEEEAEYYNKRLSILGDSISTHAGSGTAGPDGHLIADGQYTYPGNHCRYPQNNLLTNVDRCYWKILINTLHMVLGINESWAGSRVSWDGATESDDIGADKHIASQTRIDHLGANGTPDIILVNAGTNDIIQNVTVGTFNTENPANYTSAQIASLPVATFADAYRAMLIRLLKTYPASEVVCMLPNFTTSAYYTPQKQDPYLEIIKEACDYFGVKWIDARAFGISIYNLNTYLGDGVHPNAAGMKKLADDLIKKFKFDVAI